MKGKDIKVPFDCLWHYFTRRFESVSNSKSINDRYDRFTAQLHVDRYHHETLVTYCGPTEGFEEW